MKAIIWLAIIVFKILTSDILWGFIGVILIGYSTYSMVVISVETVQYGFKSKKDVKDTIFAMLTGLILAFIGIAIWIVIFRNLL